MEKQELLVTGANGFLGQNLTDTLKQKGFTGILPCDEGTDPAALDAYASRCGFVFHLAGSEAFTNLLLSALEKHKNNAPVLSAVCDQACDQRVLAHARATGAPVYIYKLPGVCGTWSGGDGGNVTATLCCDKGLPVTVGGPDRSLVFAKVDDVTSSFLAALRGTTTREGNRCAVRPLYKITMEV
ncbi:MAG: NAD-dependent epimerase/dehydratase family protein [Oscillospiraceae bacterium]|jgi:UDP-2-acetamido-2,6-beta-L-arabino-hexul-4-ose reductase|nr:NAD-dependent epimerase/dehydratase family protein [Oscillospiraceae bacterium]